MIHDCGDVGFSRGYPYENQYRGRKISSAAFGVEFFVARKVVHVHAFFLACGTQCVQCTVAHTQSPRFVILFENRTQALGVCNCISCLTSESIACYYTQ